MDIDFENWKDKMADLAVTGMAKAKELTGTGVAKAKELTEISKLKVQNAAEQEAIRKAYLELGKLYYAERGSAPDAAYAGQCQKITSSLAKISYNNERIADIKAAGNLTDADTILGGTQGEDADVGQCSWENPDSQDNQSQE